MTTELLSLQEIDALEAKMLENESAKERNEAPPHVITKEQMKLAVSSLRAHRGSVKAVAPGKTKATVTAVNVDDLL